MKEKMSALDIKFCIEELEEILEAWTEKIYEMDGTFLFRFNLAEGDKKELIIEPGKRIHLTTKKHETPRRPPSYAMLLRKHLSNKRLKKIRQPDFERIVELEFKGGGNTRFLIVELFGEGNLLLCDKKKEIIKPYRARSWKHRKLEAGEKYSLPPKKGKDITSVERKELKNILNDSPDLVRGLAQNLSIGGNLAEEICARTGIGKSVNPENLSNSELDTLYTEIQNLLSAEVSPQIVYKEDEPSRYIPFQFETLEDLNYDSFESFNQTLDEYFQNVLEQEFESKKKDIYEEKVSEIEKRLEEQKKQLEDLKNRAKETKEKADAISTHHEKIDRILQKLEEIRDEKGWNYIEEELEKPKNSRKDRVKRVSSLDPQEGTVSIELPEFTVTLDFRISSFENASNLYENNKKLKEKIKGTKSAIEKTERELEEIKEEDIEIPSKSVPKTQREKEWYEKYRWFYSSDNLLVIGGRDKKTNQEVVEKQMEDNDIYLHADLEGAPHVIIKNKDGKIPDSTIKEAAIFAGIHSRAWKKGIGNVDVYWVEPEQVSKETPAGEYLPKGSYMIKGERNYQTVPLEAAVGLLEEEDFKIPTCGPPSAIKANSDVVIEIKPDGTKKSELAHEIKEKLDEEAEKEIDLDELMQILPPGSGIVAG